MAPKRAGSLITRVKKRDPVIKEFTKKLLNSIHETKDEIELSRDALTEKASEHINDGDLILTYGCSHTLINFFIEAKESAQFEVIVCETAPGF